MNVRSIRLPIEPLIEALSSATFYKSKRAAFEALYRITGKNYGLDSTKWRKWFEKNRAKYEKTQPKN